MKVSLPEQPADVALLREVGASIAQNQSASAFVRTRRRLMAAYDGGWVDELLMRFVDLMLSIPGIFLLILIGSLVQVGPAALALIIALLSWFGLARLVRAETLSIKQREYVEAAHALGIG